FRHHVRHGSLLALVALAVNLALSFGHVHALVGQASDADQQTLATTLPQSSGAGQMPVSDRHNHADDLCPICMAAATVGNGVAPTPPALPARSAERSADRVIMAAAVVNATRHRAFYSRGPPLS